MARLEVITGPMFSGKSEETVKRLKRVGYKKKRILVIKPSDDTRSTRDIFAMINDDKYLKSYKELRTKTIGSFEELRTVLEDIKPNVLVADEAQFFGLWLVDAVKELMDIHDEDDDFVIIVTGLYKDFLKNKFGPIPELIIQEEPDEITIISAVCHKCEKRPAQSTYKIGGSPNQQKEVGDSEKYQARCRACHKLHE